MEKKISWGVLGAGDIVRKRVAPALISQPDSVLTAVSRKNQALLADFSAEFGFKKTYSDWQSLVSDPEIDAVYIATPVNLHMEQTIAALKAGKHVLCEKPMALSNQEGLKMIAAAKEAKRLLGVAYYRRFYPVIHRIQEIISQGLIGEPAYVSVLNFEQFDRSAGEPRSWLLDRRQSGGGPMMDMGCHRIDVLIMLFGTVADVSTTLANTVYKREAEDTAVATIRFNSGTVATVASVHAVAESRDTLEIYGSEGSIKVTNLNKGEFTLVTRQGSKQEVHPPAENVHLPLIEDFANAVLNNTAPLIDGETALQTTIVLDKVYGR